MKKKTIILFFIAFSFLGTAQEYSRKDSLRGNLTELRTCYDVTFYDLFVMVDQQEKSLEKSYNIIHFNVVSDFDRMQIDLALNMEVLLIQFEGIELEYSREFDAVFITGLEDGLCPHEQSLSESDGLEEERRLMYVAVTRAKNKLYLTLAQSRMLHGQTRYNIPSRFLDEIPDQLVKRLNSMKKQDIISSAIKTAPRSESKHEIKIGSSVTHPKFGQGVVTGYEGNENDLRIQIKFSTHGVKWLAMEFAKLTQN